MQYICSCVFYLENYYKVLPRNVSLWSACLFLLLSHIDSWLCFVHTQLYCVYLVYRMFLSDGMVHHIYSKTFRQDKK